MAGAGRSFDRRERRVPTRWPRAANEGSSAARGSKKVLIHNPAVHIIFAGPVPDLAGLTMDSRRRNTYEFGYLNLKPEQSNTFFKLMEERYTRHSTILTTNLGYDEWQNFLGNKSMVDALLSRVRHYCHTVSINGPSLREPQG
jgi:hypothetical protein